MGDGAQTNFLGNSVQNWALIKSKVLREVKRRTEDPTIASGGMSNRKLTSRDRVLTLSRLDISSVRQVSLYTDNNVFEMWKKDRGQDIVRDALFKQNHRVGSEPRVCGKCCGQGGGIVASLGVRDDICRPSQSERHGGYNRGEILETHDSAEYQILGGRLSF